jgi:maltooligosyltrehalose trehalohydrolase
VVSFEELKVAAGSVILSPFIPLLFMGEEYAETTPFPYFISHSDPALIDAVRHGRRDEFAAFGWQGEIPDPQEARTFLRAKLNHELRNADEHLVMLKFYRELITIRKKLSAFKPVDQQRVEVVGFDKERMMVVHRWYEGAQALWVANLGAQQASAPVLIPPGHWRKVVDSADETWRGKGSLLLSELAGGAEERFALAARSFALFLLDKEEPTS